jgi:hypothetical protein
VHFEGQRSFVLVQQCWGLDDCLGDWCWWLEHFDWSREVGQCQREVPVIVDGEKERWWVQWLKLLCHRQLDKIHIHKTIVTKGRP